eukprot:TRINITY_DN8155_c0_g1_i1.p1 TRINITY_DN8155_c0_g1~~TRINITY_DN8155_c0_g1_i1.p1  ORF type:complete len:789 (-),score=100.61 TRINITY_DN8155_c0_g1_i1:41-2407(-)
MSRKPSKSKAASDFDEPVSVSSDGTIRGWLAKRGRAIVGGGLLNELTWKKRWFVQQGHRLFYLKEKTATKPKGYIDLLEISVIEPVSDPVGGIKLYTRDRTFLLKASSLPERDRWAELLKERCPKLVSTARMTQSAVDQADQLQAVAEGTKSVFAIPSSEIKFLHQLGKGSFGTVHLGIWEGSFYAIKTLDPSLGPSVVDSFVREAQLSFSIKPHNCVTRVYGMCIEVSKYALVMEFCPKGSLEAFLRSASASNPREPIFNSYSLYKLAIGIASGMAHLTAQGIVHRDLAARNVLLGLNMIPKISDFGMSRKLDSDASVYQTSNANPEKMLGPILWSAPETLDNIYNQATDVWSYGCILIEMMTGKAPYASQTFSNILELATRIRGQGLTPLSDLDWLLRSYGVASPPWLRELAALCFHASPERRPTFQHICSFLEKSNPDFFSRYQTELDNAELARQNLNASVALSATSSSSTDTDAQQDTASRLEMEAEKVDISSLKLLSELGSGSYGKVFLGQVRSGLFCAVKQWTARAASSEGSLHREFEIMTALPKHKNLVRTYGLITEGETMSIVMEFVPCGSLDNFIKRYKKQFGNLSTLLLWKLAVGIASGMAKLAEHKLVHRDLSARNVLLDSETEPKVSDFGFSRALKAEQSVAQTQTDVGPIRWMSPEQFNGLYSEKSDVWSWACTVVEMTTGDVPHAGTELLDVLINVRDRRMTPLTGRPASTPAWILPLLNQCFAYDPSQRPTFQQIIHFMNDHKPQEVQNLERSIMERQRRRQELVSLLDSVVV